MVRWDKAGERVMAEAARRAAQHPGRRADPPLQEQHRQQGRQSYGAHENYLMRRQTPFADIVTHLTPFFVTRQVVCGAGRVGIGQDGREPGFQISQRADFFEVEVGLETTLKRPIINTRDEPHADADKYRRLHVIIGDANLSEISTYLKVGTTALVLAMIEDKVLTGDLGDRRPGRRAARRSATTRRCTHLIRLRDGRRLTALDIQWAYLERAAHVRRRTGTAATSTTQTADVLARWESGAGPARARPDAVRRRAGLGGQAAAAGGLPGAGRRWTGPSHKLQLVDLQYSDVRPEKGLYHRLVARGAMQTLVTEERGPRAR